MSGDAGPVTSAGPSGSPEHEAADPVDESTEAADARNGEPDALGSSGRPHRTGEHQAAENMANDPPA